MRAITSFLGGLPCLQQDILCVLMLFPRLVDQLHATSRPQERAHGQIRLGQWYQALQTQEPVADLQASCTAIQGNKISGKTDL